MKNSHFSIVFLIPFITFFNFLNKENTNVTKNPTENKKYELGLILPIKTNSESIQGCCFYMPQNGFTIYDAPEGKKIGVLTVQEEMYEPFVLTYFDTSTPNKFIEMTNMKTVGYEEFAFTYFETENGFLRILNNSASYWVSLNEIIENDFETIDYQTFLIKYSNRLLGYYAKDSGLNLKKEPNKKSELIKILKGDLLEIHPQNETHANWVKVDVVEYKQHPCNTEFEPKDNIIKKYEGWVELVTKKGEINVKWYSGGC